MPEERYAPLYAGGSWSSVVDEVGMLWDLPENDRLDSAEVRKKAGFTSWVSFGSLDGLSLPMSLEVYQRDNGTEPQYVIDVEGTGGNIPHVYTRTLPDVMDLLTQWAPLLQATAVTDFLRQLNDPTNPHWRAPALDTLRSLLSRE
jgi:hypothetical protein